MAWGFEVIHNTFVFACRTLLGKVNSGSIGSDSTESWIWSPNVENLWASYVIGSWLSAHFHILL